MREAMTLKGSPTDQSITVRLIATITPAEATIRRNANHCSPRANVAFAALDAVRSIVSLLSRFLLACKTRASGIHDAKGLPTVGCDKKGKGATSNTPRQ
jgi:hypothetical protein